MYTLHHLILLGHAALLLHVAAGGATGSIPVHPVLVQRLHRGDLLPALLIHGQRQQRLVRLGNLLAQQKARLVLPLQAAGNRQLAAGGIRCVGHQGDEAVPVLQVNRHLIQAAGLDPQHKIQEILLVAQILQTVQIEGGLAGLGRVPVKDGGHLIAIGAAVGVQGKAAVVPQQLLLVQLAQLPDAVHRAFHDLIGAGLAGLAAAHKACQLISLGRLHRKAHRLAGLGCVRLVDQSAAQLGQGQIGRHLAVALLGPGQIIPGGGVVVSGAVACTAHLLGGRAFGQPHHAEGNGRNDQHRHQAAKQPGYGILFGSGRLGQLGGFIEQLPAGTAQVGSPAHRRHSPAGFLPGGVFCARLGRCRRTGPGRLGFRGNGSLQHRQHRGGLAVGKALHPFRRLQAQGQAAQHIKDPVGGQHTGLGTGGQHMQIHHLCPAHQHKAGLHALGRLIAHRPVRAGKRQRLMGTARRRLHRAVGVFVQQGPGRRQTVRLGGMPVAVIAEIVNCGGLLLSADACLQQMAGGLICRHEQLVLFCQAGQSRLGQLGIALAEHCRAKLFPEILIPLLADPAGLGLAFGPHIHADHQLLFPAQQPQARAALGRRSLQHRLSLRLGYTKQPQRQHAVGLRHCFHLVSLFFLVVVLFL